MNDEVEDVGKAKSDRMLSLVAKFLAVATVLASMGGVFLHLCGYIAQRTYLRAFNVDPDSFTREADWLMVNGYYSTMPINSVVAQSVFSWSSFWLFVWVLLTVAMIRFVSLKEPPEWIKKIKAKQSSRNSGKSRLITFLVEAFLYSGLVWSIGYLLVLCAILVVLVPGVTGERFGESVARKDATAFGTGCVENNPCSELWQGDKKIASGFVVATSSEQIAFFDTQIKMVRQVERSGIEVRSPVHPKFSVEFKGAQAPAQLD